jgi:integrase
MTDMPRPRPKYLHKQYIRGKVAWYVRVGKGPRVRIHGEYGSVEFLARYDAAIRGEAPAKPSKARVGTLSWLIERYRESSAWANLSIATRRQRENIFFNVCKTAAEVPYSKINRKAIVAGRDRRSDTPAAAKHFLQSMRGLFDWAVEAEHVRENPARGVKVSRPRTEGFHVWTEEECKQFEACWEVGTRQRLAYDILLYTGLRRGDAVRLGRQHVKSGVATIRTEKTGEVVSMPLLPPLQASIEATPTGDLTFIAGIKGKPRTKEAFGTWFREACQKAGVPGSAHGIRKAGATRAANNGATVAQLEAMYGWRGGRMASLYTWQADRVRLAADGAAKLLDEKRTSCSAQIQMAQRASSNVPT